MPPRRFHAILLVLFFIASTAAAEEDPQLERPMSSLAELAAQSDLVALARVSDTDYRLQRELPVSGSAWLEVLFSYKGQPPDRRIEVFEKGLHPGECYFRAPPLGAEGARFLVFLRLDPEEPGRYRGLQAGCAVDVLVDRENRYAVRLPVTGLPLSDDLTGLASPMSFADRHAIVSDEDLVPADRNAMLEDGYIEALEGGRRWRFTQGVELSAFRQLLGEQGQR